MNENVVRIQYLITEVDMRPTKSLTTGKFRIFGKLGRGQIALLLNRACTIARFVDSEKTIHTMYSEPGRLFDLATIEHMVAERTLAIGVKVIRNPAVKPKRVSGLSMEKLNRPKKARKKVRKAA
jgi:hypothetical protein